MHVPDTPDNPDSSESDGTSAVGSVEPSTETCEHAVSCVHECGSSYTTPLLSTASYSTIALAATWNSMYAVASWVSRGFSGIHSLFVAPEYDKNNVAEAISKLQTTLVFLDSKMETMNTNIDKYTSEARRLYAKRNRTGAIHQLRLKKMYEREVMKMDSLKFNLESNILHMESVGVMMETVSTIKDTSHQFQVVSKHVDFTKLEDTIEEMFEQRDTSKDIQSILQGMHDSHEFDEDELLQELEQLSDSEAHAPGGDRPDVQEGAAVAAEAPDNHKATRNTTSKTSSKTSSKTYSKTSSKTTTEPTTLHLLHDAFPEPPNHTPTPQPTTPVCSQQPTTRCSSPVAT